MITGFTPSKNSPFRHACQGRATSKHLLRMTIDDSAVHGRKQHQSLRLATSKEGQGRTQVSGLGSKALLPPRLRRDPWS